MTELMHRVWYEGQMEGRTDLDAWCAAQIRSVIAGFEREQKLRLMNKSVLAVFHHHHYLQDGRAGIQMLARHGSAIPVDVLRGNVVTRRSVSPALC